MAGIVPLIVEVILAGTVAAIAAKIAVAVATGKLLGAARLVNRARKEHN